MRLCGHGRILGLENLNGIGERVLGSELAGGVVVAHDLDLHERGARQSFSVSVCNTSLRCARSVVMFKGVFGILG